MNITFACGRCAHQFRVMETEQSIAVVCPQCGFTHCYRVGVLADTKRVCGNRNNLWGQREQASKSRPRT